MNKMLTARHGFALLALFSVGLTGCFKEISTDTEFNSGDRPVSDPEPVERLSVSDLPDYAGLYRGILESVLQSERRLPRHAFHGAVIAVRLHEVSGTTEHGVHALDLFREGLRAVTSQQEGHPILDGFHEHRSFGLACFDLQRLGLLTDDDREALRPVVRFWLEEFVLSFEPGTRNQRTLFRMNQEGQAFVDHNIRLANMVAAAALSRFLAAAEGKGALELCAEVDAWLEAYWQHLMQTGDLDENASNYSFLGQAFLLDLARILNREGELADSETFRRMFSRALHQLSPTGLMPEFGDSYFRLTPGMLDVCYVLESAAVLYGDPTLLAAAREQFNGVQRRVPGLRDEDNWYRGFGLIHQKLSPYKPSVSQTVPSVVTLRNRRTRDGVEEDRIDKLVLRTGREPGSAMVLMDLYAEGSHSHLEKGPSVAYFEAAGVPLFHNMGRHKTRSAILGNLFWTQEDGDNFPGIWKTGRWFTARIPLRYLVRDSEQEDQYRIERAVTFRNFQEQNRHVDYLFLDNLRLQGPAGTLILDDFEDASTWHRNVYGVEGVEMHPSEDATEGRFSQRLNWNILPSGFCSRLFKNASNFVFSGSEYTELCLDLKYEGEKPYINLRAVVDTPIDLGDQTLPTRIESAKVEQRGEDAFGEIAYSQYSAGNARLTRRMVLTGEGILVIQDTCTPSPEMADWTGGQLWQLYDLDRQGKSWFSSAVYQGYPGATDGARRVLVKYRTDAETETFLERIEQNYYRPTPTGNKGTEIFTTGSLRRMTGAEPQTFFMVVIPHSPELDAAALAESIQFVSGPDGSSSVMLSHPALAERPIRIDLGPGSWSVVR